MKIVYLFIILTFGSYSYAIPSQRTRCAVECYSSCVFAGTKQALSCNCTLQALSASNCTFVDEEMFSTELEGSDSISVWSQYISAHSIQLKIQSFPSAFIYIFEYAPTNSSIKDEDKEWMYGGSSSTPSISFSISDLCNEYQFRVIIILKTADPTRFMKVLSPIIIPQQLPSMDIPSEKISIQMPEVSEDGNTITTSFSWALPNGYMSYDIFGYESPQAYSINCFSNPGGIINEEEYEKPSIEVLKSGGGIMIWTLPIEFLKNECRIWMEVKMVPRCSKVEVTDVSTSIDLDCDAFPKLPTCVRENKTSQCIDVIDIWGEGKKTNIHWQIPQKLGHDEKFFHVMFGKAKQYGGFPYTMWKIDDLQETLVNTSTNHLQIEIEPNTPYAVQVCTIKDSSSMKTGTEKIGYIIPFICSYCEMKDKIIDGRYCLECQKIEKRMPTFNAICPRNNYCNVPTKLGYNNEEKLPEKATIIEGDTRQLNDGKKVQNKINITKNGFGTITDLSYFTKASPEVVERQFDTKTVSNISPIPFSNNDTGIRGTIQAVEVKAIVNDEDDSNIVTSTIKTKHRPMISTPSNMINSHSQDVLEKKIHIIDESEKSTSTIMSTTTTSIPTTTTNKKMVTQKMMTTTATTTTTTTKKLTFNTISQIHYNGNNLYQGPCRMRSGIICEYGCRSEASCTCPSYLNTSCIRGLSCPPIPDTIAYYNETTSTINIVNKSFFKNITGNQNLVKSFTHLHLDISESGEGFYVKRISKSVDLKEMNRIVLLNGTGIPFNVDNNIIYRVGGRNVYSINICLYNDTLFRGGPSIYYSKLTPLPFATIKDYIDRYQVNNVQVLSEDTYKLRKNKEFTKVEEPKSQTSSFVYIIPFVLIFLLAVMISLLIYYFFVKRYQRLGNVAFYGTVHNPLHSTLQLSAYRPTIEHLPNEYFINTLDVNNVLPRVKIPTSFGDNIYHDSNIHRPSSSYVNGSFERDSQELSLSEDPSVKINERRI